MCEAVEFEYLGERMVATANAEGSRLPVRLRNGTFLLVPWGAQGRRFPDMKRDERIEWPNDPCLALERIKAGAVADCEPRPVRIVATRFLATVSKMRGLEIDQWIPLKPGQFLQGCYFRRGQERAVYIVTVPPPAEVISPWPRIVAGNRKSDRM